MPVVLKNGEVLAYLSTDGFGGASKTEIKTIIETKNGKKMTLPGYRVLKSEGESKVYINGYREFNSANAKDLTVISKKKMDE